MSGKVELLIAEVEATALASILAWVIDLESTKIADSFLADQNMCMYNNFIYHSYNT